MYLQIQHTAAALKRQGVEVVFHDSWRNPFEQEVDLCHCFSTHQAGFGVFRAALDRGVPCVWSNVLNIFDKSRVRLRLETRLSAIIPGFLPTWKEAASLAARSTKLIALNELEAEVLGSLFPVAKGKILTIPNGFDRNMAGADPNLFRQTFGISTLGYVVNVAKVGPVKNQLKLIEAAKGQDWTLAIVGVIDDSDYSRACRAASFGHPNILLTGALPYSSPLLASAYAGSSVFCLPSHSEVQPLTLIEAAQNNCNLVVSRNFPVQSFLQPHVIRINPDDPAAIRAGINLALSRPPTGTLDAISAQPSWDLVATRVRGIYDEIQGSRR
jgi:glycosyltransferase involved in cell wall biosynthesis